MPSGAAASLRAVEADSALVVRLTDGSWFAVELTAEEWGEIDRLLAMLTGPGDRQRGITGDDWLSAYEIDSGGNMSRSLWRIRKDAIVSAAILERSGSALVGYTS